MINRGISRGFETIHVRRGRSLGEIDYLFGEQNSRNTSNGEFRVEADDYQLRLKPTMFSFRQSLGECVTSTEAAQFLWDELLSKVDVDYA